MNRWSGDHSDLIGCRVCQMLIGPDQPGTKLLSPPGLDTDEWRRFVLDTMGLRVPGACRVPQHMCQTCHRKLREAYELFQQAHLTTVLLRSAHEQREKRVALMSRNGDAAASVLPTGRKKRFTSSDEMEGNIKARYGIGRSICKRTIQRNILWNLPNAECHGTGNIFRQVSALGRFHMFITKTGNYTNICNYYMFIFNQIWLLFCIQLSLCIYSFHSNYYYTDLRRRRRQTQHRRFSTSNWTEHQPGVLVGFVDDVGEPRECVELAVRLQQAGREFRWQSTAGGQSWLSTVAAARLAAGRPDWSQQQRHCGSNCVRAQPKLMVAFGAGCSSMLICTPKQYFCEAGSSGLRQHGGYRVHHPSHHVHFYTSYDAEEWTCAETDIRTGFRRARIENDPRVRQLSFLFGIL